MKTDAELFGPFDYDSIDIANTILTDKQIDKLMDDTDQLFHKVTVPLVQASINIKVVKKIAINIYSVLWELNKRHKKLKDIILSLTRCRRCGYYPFMVNSGEQAACPKCGVVHLAP